MDTATTPPTRRFRAAAASRTTALLLLALVAAACSPSSENVHRVRVLETPGRSPGATAPAPASATPSASSSPGPASTSNPFPSIPPDTPDPSRADYAIFEVTGDQIGWGGPGCLKLTRGNPTCRAPFQGRILIQSVPSAVAVLQAYENGRDVPAASRVLKPVPFGRTWLCPGDGCPFDGAWLPYVPGADAETVRFAVELRDENGKRLARRFSGGFPVFPA